MQHWSPGTHTSTFLGNAVNLAAGRAAIAVMRRDRLWERSARLARHSSIECPRSRDPRVGDVPAWAVHRPSSRDRASREPDPEASADVRRRALERGVAGRGRPVRERGEDQSAADDRGRPGGRGDPGGDRSDRRTRLIETGVGVREVRNYIDGRGSTGRRVVRKPIRDRRSRGDRSRVQSRRPVRGDRCGTTDVRRHRLVDDGRQALRDPLRARPPAARGRHGSPSSSRARWASRSATFASERSSRPSIGSCSTPAPPG